MPRQSERGKLEKTETDASHPRTQKKAHTDANIPRNRLSWWDTLSIGLLEFNSSSSACAQYRVSPNGHCSHILAGWVESSGPGIPELPDSGGLVSQQCIQSHSLSFEHLWPKKTCSQKLSPSSVFPNYFSPTSRTLPAWVIAQNCSETRCHLCMSLLGKAGCL